jgi:hypothetical protein
MTSLDDLWDDNSSQKNYSPMPQSDVVSSKVVKHMSPPTPPKSDATITQHIEALVIELHELRREQARRTTVYIVLIGILFATLIVYIDKLQNEVRSLKTSRLLEARPSRFV